jgi:hypothetical protein
MIGQGIKVCRIDWVGEWVRRGGRDTGEDGYRIQSGRVGGGRECCNLLFRRGRGGMGCGEECCREDERWEEGEKWGS